MSKPNRESTMKTQIAALALALVTLAAVATPKTAKANDAGAILGGFIGGVIIANALNDHHHGTVVVRDGDRCDDNRGYWRDVSVRIWVPGAWVFERDHHGRHCRRYIAGHYELRTDRVWMAYNDYDRHDRRDYGRRDRDWGRRHHRR
jgi:hypothetical protein